MPIHCQTGKNGQTPGYCQWGNHGHKYPFTPGNQASLQAARNAAGRQAAAYANGYKGK